ncbi:hypothetical protein C0989_001338 [Termitomyces sp. Mn162]|nr:hypothetical protein C0989_001338 [Termitomyces sp. Mn162]
MIEPKYRACLAVLGSGSPIKFAYERARGQICAIAMSLPEELLERILAHVVAAPTPRPHWLRSPTRLASLSVSRQFHRIATPLLYRVIHLTDPRDAARLLHTLHASPHYARHVRELVVHGLWCPVVDILGLCRGLSSLDLTLALDDDVDLDCVLAPLADMRHLTVRKPAGVYLSLPRARALIASLAHAIPSWPHLVRTPSPLTLTRTNLPQRTAHIAFKLSDDTPTSPTLPPLSFTPPPSQPSTGPISSLASALAASPALHTFSTHLPSVWNTAIATIASNPALQRIALVQNTPAAIPGTGLFLMEARRHPRLAELIAAGTPIIRSRAHTLGTRVPPTATTTTTTTAAPAAKQPIGLGLRIDTSDETISPALQYASPVASTAGARAVNPAWMGPVRGASVKCKGKRRR